MNVVTLIGNLATDVELRDVGDERQVANFVLAVDRPGKDDADFIRVSTWNKQAELCAQYLEKGRKVGVDGRLRSSSWEDSDGNKRSAVEVVANRVEFLTPRAGKGGGGRHPLRSDTSLESSARGRPRRDPRLRERPARPRRLPRLRADGPAGRRRARGAAARMRCLLVARALRTRRGGGRSDAPGPSRGSLGPRPACHRRRCSAAPEDPLRRGDHARRVPPGARRPSRGRQQRSARARARDRPGRGVRGDRVRRAARRAGLDRRAHCARPREARQRAGRLRLRAGTNRARGGRSPAEPLGTWPKPPPRATTCS